METFALIAWLCATPAAPDLGTCRKERIGEFTRADDCNRAISKARIMGSAIVVICVPSSGGR